MKTINELLTDQKEYTIKSLGEMKEKPWQYEPKYYKFWHLGLPCWIKRPREDSQLNGYVGIPVPQKIIRTGNLFKYFDFEIEDECMDQIDKEARDMEAMVEVPNSYLDYNTFDRSLFVHGGLTHSCLKNGYFILGFDTGHYCDYVPFMEEFKMQMASMPILNTSLSNVTYKTFRYVYEECKSLAVQLHDILGINKIEKYYNNIFNEMELNYKYIDYDVFCRESGEINIL
jgi:hypothetical protein